MYPDDPYRDPSLYDLEYGEQTDDVAFYVALARRYRGPMLELGCGNGRITLPVARAGVEVHGVDQSEAMLADLEQKTRLEPDAVRLRVRFRQGDFRKVAEETTAGRYALTIWPFNALHHCEGPEDVRVVLAGMRRSLRKGGRAAIDCYLPDPVLYERDPNQRYEERVFEEPRTGRTLNSWEQGWWDAAASVHHVRYVYEDVATGEQHLVHLRLRMFEQEELRSLIEESGFHIVWEAQDFRGRPLRPGSLKWVMELVPR